MLKQVCDNAANYEKYPVPVVITEWSLRTGVNDPSFERELYTQQVTAWSNTGGGIFWNLKAVNGSSNGGDNTQWSFLVCFVCRLKQKAIIELRIASYCSLQGLLEQNVIPLPSNGQSTIDYIRTLGTPCGTPGTVSWAASSSSSNNNSTTSRKTRHRARHF